MRLLWSDRSNEKVNEGTSEQMKYAELAGMAGLVQSIPRLYLITDLWQKILLCYK